MRPGERHYVALFAAHVLELEGREAFHGGCECRKLGRATALVTGERLPKAANMLCAGAVLLLQHVEDRRRFLAAHAQEAEQVFAFPRMMHAFREGVDVVDHRTQHVEARRSPPLRDLAHQPAHAVENRGQRAMIVLDDADGVHGLSSCAIRPTESLTRVNRNATACLSARTCCSSPQWTPSSPSMRTSASSRSMRRPKRHSAGRATKPWDSRSTC